jgi:hypothetical protein
VLCVFVKNEPCEGEISIVILFSGALTGLNGGGFHLFTGLHPVLMYYALSGLLMVFFFSL